MEEDDDMITEKKTQFLVDELDVIDDGEIDAGA